MSSADRCLDQNLFDATKTYFPHQWQGASSTKIFSFDLQIEIIDGKCDTASGMDLFSIVLDPNYPSTLGPVGPLLLFYYADDGVDFQYNVDYSDNTAPPALNTQSLINKYGRFPIEVNTNFELLATIDLTFGAAKIKASLAFREYVVEEETSSWAIDSSWQFGVSTQIFICATSDGYPSHFCAINAFNYWFTNPNDFGTYTGQLSPILLASYPFNEGSGYRVADLADLGTAYLGSSTSTISDQTNSPKWLNNEAGIKFSGDEFVNIKPFQIPRISEYDLGSFTLTFWIRCTTYTPGTVFTYSNPDSTFDYFNLFFNNNDGLLLAGINMNAIQATSPVSATGWSFVAVTYTLRPTSGDNWVCIFVDGNYAAVSNIAYFPPLFRYSSRNLVRIGGPGNFRGSISDFRIYSPGSSAFISKGSCTDSTLSTSCMISVGKLSSNKCLTRPEFPCHSTCKTCYDTTEDSCLSCYPNYHMSFSQCIPDDPVLSQATTEAIKGGQRAAQVVTQVVNAVSAGSPIGVSAAIGGKIFFNIKFINITYSATLESAVTTWGSSFISLGLIPDLPSSITNQIPKEEVPYIFQKREVPSSFIENFWESLGMVLLVTFIFAGVLILELSVKRFKYKYLPHPVVFAGRAVVQNYLLTQLYSVFGDLLFFAALEFRSPNTHHAWSRLSLATCIILLVIMLVILGYHMHLLLKYQYLQKENTSNDLTKFEEENKGSHVLFTDFKENSLIRQSFLLLLTGRDLLFALFLALMFDHPMAECIFILVLNLAMIAYLLLLPPFKNRFDTIQQLFYEGITFAVDVSAMILASMDENSSFETKARIGQFIIVVNFIFNFGSLAFMLFRTFQMFYEIYKEYRAKKNLKKVEPKCETSDFLVTNQNLTQQEMLPKISIDMFKNKEPIEYDLDKKHEDKTEESFIMSKEPFKDTPKFEAIPPDSYENSNQITHPLNQTEESPNISSSLPNNDGLEISSLDGYEDDKADKAILEKNHRTRRTMRLQSRLKESSIPIRSSTAGQNEDSPLDFGQDELRSSLK